MVVNTFVQRWKAAMPAFFKWIMGFGTALAAIAVAVQMALNSSGATPPEWWVTIYPYLIGAGAGMTATAKFTQQQGDAPNP